LGVENKIECQNPNNNSANNLRPFHRIFPSQDHRKFFR
jgi:hypothetical protein